jgi:glycosyltransferase involved in cell wall biosynthesis
VTTESTRDAAGRGSIVIPAWNEATVIERSLNTLFDGLSIDGGIPTVVVAANGCTDDTVARVRRLQLPVEILDLPAVGKAGAIRAAERAAEELPRLYLDADTVIHGSAATAVLETLSSGHLAARPPVVFDLEGASRPIRWFYEVRSQLPNLAIDLCGAGVYGLSRDGRSRFAEIPNVSGDDLFVARHFTPDEVVIVPCEPVVVRPPRTVRSLVHTLGRVYRGNSELEREAPDVVTPTTSTTARELVRLVDSPRRLLQVVVYTALVVAGRIAARRPTTSWERDDTGRSA